MTADGSDYTRGSMQLLAIGHLWVTIQSTASQYAKHFWREFVGHTFNTHPKRRVWPENKQAGRIRAGEQCCGRLTVTKTLRCMPALPCQQTCSCSLWCIFLGLSERMLNPAAGLSCCRVISLHGWGQYVTTQLPPRPPTAASCSRTTHYPSLERRRVDFQGRTKSAPLVRVTGPLPYRERFCGHGAGR
jgi:hypothetical protein